MRIEIFKADVCFVNYINVNVFLADRTGEVTIEYFREGNAKLSTTLKAEEYDHILITK